MNEVKFKRQRFGDPKRMIERLKKQEVSFYMRQGTDCTEIIVGDVMFTWTSTKNFPRAKLFLFTMVKRNVITWLAKRTSIDMPPVYDSVHINFDYDDSYGEITGTDINHAYWRIAFLRGLIAQNTYEHGLGEGCKALRLATLSVLGREKKFTEYVNGEEVNQHITQAADPMLKQVFAYIRLTCFNMMHELAMKLGKDFECWKTDCIYYRDTPENRKLVSDFFDKRNMSYKQLDYFEPEKENTDITDEDQSDLATFQGIEDTD